MPFRTDLRQGLVDAWGISEADVLAKILGQIPLGRYRTPEEVAGLVGYLVTDTAASITAQALNVCGGVGTTATLIRAADVMAVPALLRIADYAGPSFWSPAGC